MNAGDPREPRWLDDAPDPGRRRLRQALDEAERATPSDLRARRVWTRLQDDQRTWLRRGRSALLAAFGLGAALACAVMALVFLGGRDQKGDARLAQGQAGAPAVDAPATPALAMPQLLQAGATSLTHTLNGGAALELAPGSTVALAHERPEVRAGRVHFAVPPQRPGQWFAVGAADYEVVVIGTAFFVSVDHADAVGVEVDHGVVEVWTTARPRTRVARLGAGERWHTPLPVAPEPAASEPAPPPERQPAKAPHASAALTLALAEARQSRARHPQRAADLLARLAQGDGPVAENALYELGAILREDLAQPRKAVATWQRYRARFPQGLLRAEVDVSVIETLAALGDRERALGEALVFLDRHRDSERLGDIARVAGDLQRARGDCRAALPLYRRVAGARASAANRDDAAFFAASCLIDLGDARGREALAAYLRERAQGRHAGEARRLFEAVEAARPR
jgi:predicted flap endonuclease-1-like 5' DNA nuclease